MVICMIYKHNNKMFNFIKRNILGIISVALGFSFVLGFELRSGAGTIFTGIPLGLTWITIGIIGIFITEKYKKKKVD